MTDDLRADELVQSLALQPHPEGGWYREIYRSPIEVTTARGPRAALTTIYYLLERHQLSRWHVVAADELWHFYGGSSLELYSYDPVSRRLSTHVLGVPAHGQEPIAVVSSGVWQAARSCGDYSLVGCSVGPGFEFADFRLVWSLEGHEEHFSGDLTKLKSFL